MKKRIFILITLAFFSVAGCSGDLFDRYEKGVFSATSSVTPDTAPPVLVKAEAVSRSQIQLEFSEPLDTTAANNVNNYHVQGVNRIEITGATYATKKSRNGSEIYTVTLDVLSHNWSNRMVTGKVYTLLALGIKDLNGNLASYETTTFTGVGWVVAEMSLASDSMVAVPENINPGGDLYIYVQGADIQEYQYSYDGGLWSQTYDTATPIDLSGLNEDLYTLKDVG